MNAIDRSGHAALLAEGLSDNFLKMLSFYEKFGLIESISGWQLYRTVRNLAAHDYETDNAPIAEHFNTLRALFPALYADAAEFAHYCDDALNIRPTTQDFARDFHPIVENQCPPGPLSRGAAPAWGRA